MTTQRGMQMTDSDVRSYMVLFILIELMQVFYDLQFIDFVIDICFDYIDLTDKYINLLQYNLG